MIFSQKEQLRIYSLIMSVTAIVFTVFVAVLLGGQKTGATVPNPAIFSKTVANSTTTAGSDWNMLDEQFVDQLGDSVDGDLDMGGFTVTGLPVPGANADMASKDYADSLILTLAGSVATDVDGGPLNVICDHSPNGGWSDNGYNQGVWRNISTQGGGGPNFTATPIYLYVIGADFGHLTARVNSIFNPTPTGFQARFETALSDTLANNRHMHAIWCGIGN